MKLSELIKVDSRFEKSINLSLDLTDPAKVNYYIPTRSALKILEGFLDNVTVQARNRATILVGPYGKGKSHLLLVLMALLSRSEAPEVKELVTRIGNMSSETVAKINSATKKGGRFLPVIVNPSGGTLYSMILKSTQQALLREGISDVVPDSYYTEAVHAINSWKNDYPDAYERFLEKLGEDENDFMFALMNSDDSSLEKFRKIYPYITSGSVFNPIVNEDIKDILKTVNRKLCEKYGYRGIYIIFDEFSKYIEGHEETGFAADMGTLQDVCEVCSKSKDEQIHLTLVAHKAIRSYGDKLPKSVINTFEAIEGRLSEVLFVTSSQNNYELIADALGKTKKFGTWTKKYAPYGKISEESHRLPEFQSLFNEDDYRKIVAEGVFPLTPVGAMLLLNLSEKIAQNERTIFTYLTDESSNGLATYIADKEAGFVSAGNIYDYFVPLFREESDNSVHHVWLKADYAISKTEDAAEKDIIKAMAIIKMINRPDDLPASDRIMRLACGMDEETFKKALDGLVEKSLIEYKAYNNAYEFKNNIGVDVEIAISDCIEKHFAKPDIVSVLEDVATRRFELPKKHNSEKCITRYFNYRFMTKDSFLALNDTSYLDWNNQPDGAIFLILPEEGMNRKALKKHMEELGDRCTLMLLPATDDASYVGKVKYLLAVRYLEKDTAFIDDNPVLLKELKDLEEETAAVLDEAVNSMYFKAPDLYGTEGKIKTTAHGINRIVSDICDREYSLAPVFNHESINRHEPSSQMVKARNNVIRDILEGKDLDEYINGSSAESTICRALLLNSENDKGVKAVNKEIADFMKKSIDNRAPFSDVTDILTKPPYGVRKGVLPVLLAKQLVSLGEIPVIYLNEKEVAINEIIMSNILDSPSEYFIYIEPKTVSKLDYISKLESLFEEYAIYCADIDKRNRLAKLTCMMQSWYRSLPQASITYSTSDNDRQMREINAFRKIFQTTYINPREVILDKLPKMLKTEDLEKTYKKVESIKTAIDRHIHEIKEAAIKALLETLSFDAGSNLKQSLKSWYENLPEDARNRIYSTAATDFLNYIKTFSATDPEVIIREVAKNITGTFIEDWNDMSMNDFRVSLDCILSEIDEKAGEDSASSYSISVETPEGEKEEKKFSYDPENISSNGSFFQNQLSELIEEYGGAVDSDEKIGILLDAIKKIMR